MTNNTKTCNDSRLVFSLGLIPRDYNNASMLFGGKLMDILDNLSGTVAMNHCERLCVTASVDSVDFVRGVMKGDLLYAESYVSGVGTRSMEVFTKFLGRTVRGGQEYIAAFAFLTFATMEEGEIFGILPESKEEKIVCEGYCNRKENNLNRRLKHKELLKNINCKMIWK